MKIGRTRKLILLRNLNSRRRKLLNNNVISICEESVKNYKGHRLIDISRDNVLEITNGFHKPKDIHKYTWVQRSRNLISMTALADEKTCYE